MYDASLIFYVGLRAQTCSTVDEWLASRGECLFLQRGNSGRLDDPRTFAARLPSADQTLCAASLGAGVPPGFRAAFRGAGSRGARAGRSRGRVAAKRGARGDCRQLSAPALSARQEPRRQMIDKARVGAALGNEGGSGGASVGRQPARLLGANRGFDAHLSAGGSYEG